MFEHAVVTEPGLADPVQQSQEIFRTVLAALSEPGRVFQLADMAPVGALGVGSAAVAILLALTDGDTPVWLGGKAEALANYLRFHTGSPVVSDPGAAQFTLVKGVNCQLDLFDPGNEDFPDQSATLIVEVDVLAEGGPITLSGPGIPGHRHVTVQGLPADFSEQWSANHAQFPCGVDVIVTNGTSLMGLPRTTSFAHSGR
ncbi:MAG TPA: phosphonate C-P lyase system protein PhnH [Terriglobales bacterium]|nr:phosphonate C-P lyase system protein PhnH [Terriglobales bacterium]